MNYIYIYIIYMSVYIFHFLKRFFCLHFYTIYISREEKINENEDNERDWKYLNKLLMKYIYIRAETEEKRHVLKIANKYNENKKKEITVTNIISKNISLPKGNLLLSFSEEYMQDLLDDLEHFNNFLKEYEYKGNEITMMKNFLKECYKAKNVTKNGERRKKVRKKKNNDRN